MGESEANPEESWLFRSAVPLRCINRGSAERTGAVHSLELQQGTQGLSHEQTACPATQHPHSLQCLLFRHCLRLRSLPIRHRSRATRKS